MLFKQSIILAAACAAALFTIACDESTDDSTESLACAAASLPLAPPPGTELPEPGDVSFREQGPPAALYVTEWQDKTINRAVAKQIIDACVKQIDPPQTCTLSWYQPDTTKPTFVMGLGCSMLATIPLLDCYRTKFLANDAQGI